MPVVIVGAGLGGLTCARQLRSRGIPVLVLEQSDDVGGRVRSDSRDGFTLDRGFQVLFDAYPAVKRNLDLDALALYAFEPGAIVYREGQLAVLTDPVRDRNWRDVARAVATPLLPPGDKLRTLRLALGHNHPKNDQRSERDLLSTLDYLKSQDFSSRAIDVFFRPFFGGILLQRDLLASEAAFRFYLRMLVTGRTTVPASGMGAISQQLAGPLKASGAIRCHATVTALAADGHRVTGVRLASGEEIAADAVVLACEAPAAAALAGIETPGGALHSTTLYFAGTRRLYTSRKIVLNAAPDAFVNNAQLLSNVSPAYAPPGRHLLSATVLGWPDLSDRELVVMALRDLRRIFAPDPQARAALETYYPLALYRVRYAQFPQPPGLYGALPGNRLPRPGLYAAAEWTEGSSINGAMLSGERCAAAVAADIG